MSTNRHSTLNRSHFQLIASVIATLPDDRCRLLDMRTDRPANVREIVAKHFAVELGSVSKHFSPERFMQTCGFE